MGGRLDWKWIGIGVVIMIGLNIAAGLIAVMVMGAQLKDAGTIEELSLSGGQMLFLAVLNFLAFLIGGFIVGLKSAGKTILEHTVEAIMPSPEQRALLDIEENEPCLALHRRSWSKGHVVTVVTLIYPASRYALYSRHKTSPSGRLSQ